MSKSGIDFVTLVESDELGDNPNEQDSAGRRSSNQMSRQSSVRSISTNSITSLDGSIVADNDDEEEVNIKGVGLEGTSKGKVKGITMSYYKAGAHWSVLSVLFLSFLIVQLLASSADIWVSVW